MDPSRPLSSPNNTHHNINNPQGTAAAIARMVNIITSERVCGLDYVANVADGVLLPPSSPSLNQVASTSTSSKVCACLC